MFARSNRPLFIVALLSAFGFSASAQGNPVPLPTQGSTPPSAAQAQQMLQNNPGLVARLQQMMQSSGLTPEQVRARLKAQGYPDALLDQYLPGGTRPDSTDVPTSDIFTAIRAIGLGDSLFVDSLSARARAYRRYRAGNDSAFLDTVRTAMKNDTIAAAVRTLLKSRELQRQTMDSGFTLFGADLFQKESSQFDANVTAGADANYRFGPGDKLALYLTGDVEKSYPLTVNAQGFVFIPDVGVINVAGQTRSQLEDMLYNRLGRVYSGVRRGPSASTRFYLDLGQMGTNQVYVNGDVVHPNSYRVSRASTVMTALYMAGGPTPHGSMRSVEVRRNGQVAATLDVYDYALHGDASKDVRLENGDIVFVAPRGGDVRISGAVLRPATYELKRGQTLADAIDMAGGFTPAADRRRIQVERIVPPDQRGAAGTDRRMADFSAELLATAPALGGDIIRVVEVPNHVAMRVNVRGSVWTPGALGFVPGMTLFDALRRAGGLRPDSYLGDVQVTRLRPDSTRSMLRSAILDTVGHPLTNFELADGDEITVFSTTEMRPLRYVTVGGAVKKPGVHVTFRDGMTLKDAVLLAGGLQEGALLTEAEIARLPESRAAGVTAVTTTVALDSSYLFDRGQGSRNVGPPGVMVGTGRANQEVLRPYDAITIKFQPEWELQQTVTLLGEVKFPADYSLVSRNERLSDLITRAGGLTASAYANGIVFVRKRDGVGRIGLDLPAVLRDANSVDNLRLVNGDSIFIPKFTQIVIVRGAVNTPVGVAYVDGANLDYYLRSAGGVTPTGDHGRSFVTQPNGKVATFHRHLLLWQSKPKPLPGSTVTVPLRDPNDRREWAPIATAATSILGSLVAIAAIVKR
jgi:polysaccharide biosynthesis/export protein